MTHTADCTVTTEGERVLDEIAGCFADPEQSDFGCQMEAEIQGLEHAGQGATRSTFVVSEPGIGVDSGSCVVKFARGNDYTPYSDAVEGNRREVEHWREYPDEVTEHFAPIRDHDDEYRWVTMGRVDTGETTIEDARVVLGDLQDDGWVCYDVTAENVGKLHGEPVLLDYEDRCEAA